LHQTRQSKKPSGWKVSTIVWLGNLHARKTSTHWLANDDNADNDVSLYESHNFDIVILE